MDKIIKTGIIGFGLSGRVFHAPFIHVHKGFEMCKVVERHGQSSKEFYPDVTVEKDYRELIEDPEIELVVICTPNIYHFQMAKDCLEAGKHIVIEKPFMPTSAEADEIISLARLKNRKVFVYQNRRWDGDFLTIQNLLNGGLLGDIQYYEGHFDRYAPERKRAAWRDEVQPGSGILFDLGSHLIDQVLCLFGKPETIFADVQAQRENSQVDDFFKLTLFYPNLTAFVTAGMLVKDSDLRYIVNGSKGTYAKYGIDPQEAVLKEGILPGTDEWGKESPDNWGLLTLENNKLHINGTVETLDGNYMGFYDNVYDVLVNGQEMAVKPEEARDTIRVIELAFESSKANKKIEFQK